MFTLISGGEVFVDGHFHALDVLTCNDKIIKVAPHGELKSYQSLDDLEFIEAKKYFICPGFIDTQVHLAGGSGENGFISQPPRVLIQECVNGGITTVVGAIGVDTHTKTMSNLFASVRAFREAGLTAYAYSGGYECPPKTLTETLSTDMLYVDEIIGAGEIAIADRRVPEPHPDQLARIVVDAYVGGLLTTKSGVTRIHVGEGKRRLLTIREMLERHEIQTNCLYFTHMERSKELVREGVEIAKLGSYIDFDIHEKDLEIWYKYYLEQGGPVDMLTFSTDAGVANSVELWEELRKCSLYHDCVFNRLIPHLTTIPAKALKLKNKGYIAAQFDADLVFVEKNNLDIEYVMAKGKFFIHRGSFKQVDQPFSLRRKCDWYGIRT